MSSAGSPRPWPVRVYGRAARALGAEAGDATSAFAQLYANARAGGVWSAGRLFVAALLDLGGAVWSVRRPRPFRSLGQDLRWAIRVTLRNPLASLAIIASIGVAMGASTAAFSVVNAFLLRSWGSDGLDRVVRVREDFAQAGQPPDVRGFSLSSFGPWQRENTVFESMAAGRGSTAVLLSDGRPERVSAGVVTANFFDVIGVRPVLGRTFLVEEDTPARRDAVILGDTLWRSHFGANPGVIGQRIDLNGRPRTIVGLMPPGFKHPYQAELWVPLGYQEDPSNTGGVYAPARLRVGVTLDEANREMDALAARRWRADSGPTIPTGASVTWLKPEMLGRLTGVLYMLSAAAALVLMIATANVANLLLAQSLGRQTEAAIRLALGASRARLVRQYVVHSLLLSALGAVAGIVLTFWSVGPLVALSPLYGAGEFDIEPRLDVATLAFSAGLMLVVGAVLGVLPAVRASRADASAALTDAGRSGMMSAGSRRWLNGLVVIELTLAFVLIASAVSIGQGFSTLARQPWGLDRRHVATFDVAGGAAVLRNVLARVRNMDGVTAAGASSTAPFDAGTEAAGFNTETPPPPGRDAFSAHVRTITPGYFSALSIPLLAGRDFSERDTALGQRTVIVSQSLADRYWPSGRAIGHRMKQGRLDGDGPWMEVVGVVGSLRENPVDDIPGPDAWYIPYEQADLDAMQPMTVAVKTLKPPAVLFAEVTDAVRQVDSRQPVFGTGTLDQRFQRFTSTERLTMTLTAVLGGVGLLLAAMGVYAVMAFVTRRRLSELGIRVSLGARPQDIRNLMLRESMVLAAVALAIGGGVAVFVLPAIDPGLFPETVSRVPAMIAAALCTVVAALVSSAAPARRASKVNPVTAIRS